MKSKIILIIAAVMLICAIYSTEPTEIGLPSVTVSSQQGQDTGSVPAPFPDAEGTGTKGDNPWNKILFNLINQLAAIIVPSAVGAFLIWLGKKIGWDIPDAVNTALEAAILECIAQINNLYGKEKSPEQLKELAVHMVKQALPNKLMKVLLKKYKTVDAAVEYFYRKSFKK